MPIPSRSIATIPALLALLLLLLLPAAEAFVGSRGPIAIIAPDAARRRRHNNSAITTTRPPSLLVPSSAIAAADAKNTAAELDEIGAVDTVDGASDDNDDLRDDDAAQTQISCEVLLLDHVNINHEKGRHDVLKAFYFDFLGCAIDPRKYENYVSGKKTLWANIGMHQFHLPEGKPDAQVFDGEITLVYPDLEQLTKRHTAYLDGDERFAPLKETEFLVGKTDGVMLVTDPWGTRFCILPSDDPAEDRAAHLGAQPVAEGSAPSDGLALEDLTVHVPHGANLDGIGRFYERVLGAPVVEELSEQGSSISVAMGERQTLTFRSHPEGPGADDVAHHDFSYDGVVDGGDESDRPVYPSNHGPHVSLYVTNLSLAYRRAEELGVLYVNPRFTRRAYTEAEAIDQCMFRIVEIVDPLDEGREVIVSLEHEVRSAIRSDGTKYKSCPLLEV